MAININYDFYKSFDNAYKYDKTLANELVTDEAAKILVFDRAWVKSLFVKNKIDFNENISLKDLALLLVHNEDEEDIADSFIDKIAMNNPPDLSKISATDVKAIDKAKEDYFNKLVESWHLQQDSFLKKVETNYRNKTLLSIKPTSPISLAAQVALITVVVLVGSYVIYQILSVSKNGAVDLTASAPVDVPKVKPLLKTE